MYDFCRELLRSFVTLSGQLYGEKILSYNVHALLHAVDDVEQLGPSETFSAFSYENNLPVLRNLIRKPHLTLQQIYNSIMAYLVQLKGKEKSEAKRQLRLSSSGRVLKTPQKILTSEEDELSKKKFKGSANVKEHIEKLKELAKSKGLYKQLESLTKLEKNMKRAMRKRIIICYQK